MRLEHIQRKAQAAGRDLKSLTVAEYRFFKPGEQQELISILRNSSIYIEIAHSTDRYFQDPICREALIADIRPLAEAGLQFSISTDTHSAANARVPFRPETYATPLGITPENTNGIVRELLALRAKQRQ